MKLAESGIIGVTNSRIPLRYIQATNMKLIDLITSVQMLNCTVTCGVKNEPQQHDTDHYICWGSQVHPAYNYPYLPYAAPSIGAFIGNSPLGVRQGSRTLSTGQESLLTTPGKCEKRRR
jgi:hypothetical protein